jgi:hypothetical protein
MKNPIERLNKTAAWAWFACSVIGACLAAYGINPTLVNVGKLLLIMSAGYMIFGLGLKEQSTSQDT